jgi:hypothetical protein
MLGRYQGVFRNRWKAVWWALGICSTAYCTVPREDGNPDAATQAVFAAAGSALPAGATQQLSPEQEAAMQAVSGDGGGVATAAAAMPGASPSASPSAEPKRHDWWALPGKG